MEEKANPYCSCLYYSVNALSRIMTKMAEEAFAVTGIAPSYAFLLMTVNASPGIQPKAISLRMQLTPSTVTRLIEKMEYKGFLERRSSGRATEVHPTSKSIALDKTLKQAWESLYHKYTAFLGEQAARELTAGIYDAVLKLDDAMSHNNKTTKNNNENEKNSPGNRSQQRSGTGDFPGAGQKRN